MQSTQSFYQSYRSSKNGQALHSCPEVTKQEESLYSFMSQSSEEIGYWKKDMSLVSSFLQPKVIPQKCRLLKPYSWVTLPALGDWVLQSKRDCVTIWWQQHVDNMGTSILQSKEALFWSGIFAFLSLSTWASQSSLRLCFFLAPTIFTIRLPR